MNMHTQCGGKLAFGVKTVVGSALLGKSVNLRLSVFSPVKWEDLVNGEEHSGETIDAKSLFIMQV